VSTKKNELGQFNLLSSLVDRFSSEKFSENTAHRPYIDRGGLVAVVRRQKINRPKR